MELSVLDLSPVPSTGNRHQAILNTIDTAQRAEGLGYKRIWVAEHHNTRGLAGRAPEVLIPLIAAKTNRIRVGSGSVLLNHYSPYKVAENFCALDEMFPGRIDMGIGRANTGPVSDIALQRYRGHRLDTSDSFDQLSELTGWLNNDFEHGHPFSKVKVYNNESIPELWLLGSSEWSATAAAQLGLRYAFAGFINPGSSYDITQTYMKQFVPSSRNTCVTKPDLILSVSVYCAETEEGAIRLSAPVQVLMERLRLRGDISGLLPEVDEAIRLLGGSPARSKMVDPRNPPRLLIGTPLQIKAWLEEIADAYGTNEFMIQCISPHHEKRMKSLELVAAAFNLKKQALSYH